MINVLEWNHGLRIQDKLNVKISVSVYLAQSVTPAKQTCSSWILLCSACCIESPLDEQTNVLVALGEMDGGEKNEDLST